MKLLLIIALILLTKLVICQKIVWDFKVQGDHLCIELKHNSELSIINLPKDTSVVLFLSVRNNGHTLVLPHKTLIVPRTTTYKGEIPKTNYVAFLSEDNKLYCTFYYPENKSDDFINIFNCH